MKFTNRPNLVYSGSALSLWIASFLALCLNSATVGAQVNQQANSKQKSSTESGQDEAADLAKQEEKLEKDSSTEINVRNADIAAIIRIFSKKTKRNYILDERVKGKVSIYLPGKVSNQDSIRILDSVLAYKGFTAVPIGENLWKVIPAKEARQSTIPTVTENEQSGSSASVVTRLVNLKNIAADEAKQVLAQLISPDGFINSYAATNSLIIIDNEDNIARLIGILDSIDISASDRDMTIIPVENADAVDIAAKLNELLGLGEKAEKAGASDLLNRSNGAALQQANLQRSPANNAAATSPSGGNQADAAISGNNYPGSPALSRQPKIIADERTNSIILVADETTTARVQALIQQLDSRVDLSGLRFYVYRCQHAKAEELADVLAGLVGEGSGGLARKGAGGGVVGTDSDLISGGGSNRGGSSANRNNNSSSRTGNRNSSQSRTPGKSRNENAQSNAASSVQLGDNFSISADPATNTLIIFGNRAQYEKVKALLQTLDIKRRQVLVEAMLLEVGVTDEDRLKSSFIVSGGGKDGGVLAQSFGSDILGLLSNPTASEDFSVAAASAGTLTIGGGASQIKIPTQSMLMSAISKNTNVNLLSAPTILATNNESAEIVVGQNVPFIASTSTNESNLNNTFNQVDRQDVGITLRLTPQISSRDSVTLGIFTEVSAVISTDPSLGPTTSIRTSETSVITKDGQMVVTGGLMADDSTATDNGVPFLKDVPVLGHLFRFSNQLRRRTNLLILITPRIVKDQYDARDLTIENRDVVEREIETRGIYPDRREVLRHQAIDRVAESEPYDGVSPSTILPPLNTAPKIENQGSADSDVLEFSVDPKLPPKPRFEQKDPLALKAPEQIRGALSLPQKDAFLVIELKNPNEQSINGLPFKISNKKHLAALRVPAEARTSVLNMFKTGSEIAYKIDGKSTEFNVAGSFLSAEEAKTAFPDIGNQWYEMSPYEIMKIGIEPWTRIN